MPELPEVETVVRNLNKTIVGYEIVDFWTGWEKAIEMDLAEFKRNIKGLVIKKIKRRGKNILVYLSQDWVMLVHLRMTGHLLFKDEHQAENEDFKKKVNQYIRHTWFLRTENKEASLDFSDLRKFAKIQLMKVVDLGNDLSLKKLGVEPLEKEFSLEYFWKLTHKKKKKNIKILIMDQHLIVGVGNIYASEALFEAGISPLRLAGSLKKTEVKKLRERIMVILKKAIKMRGTTDSDYRDVDGSAGEFQKVLKVYNREGEKCIGCEGLVERIKIGQRSAFWCRKCQK